MGLLISCILFNCFHSSAYVIDYCWGWGWARLLLFSLFQFCSIQLGCSCSIQLPCYCSIQSRYCCSMELGCSCSIFTVYLGLHAVAPVYLCFLIVNLSFNSHYFIFTLHFSIDHFLMCWSASTALQKKTTYSKRNYYS